MLTRNIARAPDSADLLDLADRARVMEEMQRDGVSLALPLNTEEFDLLVFLDNASDANPRTWCPIKFLGSNLTPPCGSPSNEGSNPWGLFIVARVPVGRIGSEAVATYAMTPAELRCANRVQTTTTLDQILKPYAIGPGEWRKKVDGLLGPTRGGCETLSFSRPMTA